MTDELFELRNLLTLGNYQGAINAGNSLHPTSRKIINIFILFNLIYFLFFYIFFIKLTFHSRHQG